MGGRRGPFSLTPCVTCFSACGSYRLPFGKSSTRRGSQSHRLFELPLIQELWHSSSSVEGCRYWGHLQDFCKNTFAKRNLCRTRLLRLCIQSRRQNPHSARGDSTWCQKYVWDRLFQGLRYREIIDQVLLYCLQLSIDHRILKLFMEDLFLRLSVREGL